MDNRETEADSSPPQPEAQPRISRRPRAAYNNLAANIRRGHDIGSQDSNNARDEQRASNVPDNRDSYVEVSRNNGRSSNLPTIVNDLTGSRRSNEPTNTLRGNRANHNYPNNNNNTTDVASGNSPDNNSPTRAAGTGNYTRLRRRTSNNVRGGATTRPNASTNTRNFNGSVSPMRGNNSRQRVPPLRLRGNSPSRNQELNDLHSNLNPSPDSPDLDVDLVFPSPYALLGSLGTGTEEDPFLLSPGGNDQESPPQLTDEEFARQLQQEEWERSLTPADLGTFLPPSQTRQYSFGRPARRNLPAARRRPNFSFHHSNSGRDGRLSPDGYPEASGFSVNPFSMRGLRAGARSGDNFHFRHQVQSAADLIPFLFEVFNSRGIPDADLMNILNPDRAELANDYEALIALAEQVGEVSRGLSQADINKLPTQKHDSNLVSEQSGASCAGDEPQCNICLTEYSEGETKRVMPCKHEFHKDCVDQWLKSNATCPVCRSDVKVRRS